MWVELGDFLSFLSSWASLLYCHSYVYSRRNNSNDTSGIVRRLFFNIKASLVLLIVTQLYKRDISMVLTVRAIK